MTLPDPEQFRRAMELLGEVLEMPQAARGPWLAQACGADTALLAEVESLLAAADQPVLLDRGLADLGLVDEATVAHLTAESALFPGQTLGHYRIEGKLGEGGMGTVYKASDLKLGRVVALKVLRFAGGTWQDRQRFALEARAASALNHPNIVTIYELGSEDDTDFIAMEYVDGETLGMLFGRPGLSRSALLAYARQAAIGIAAAHATGLVHRDIKPNNIMVSGSGTVKVLDFGLARRRAAMAGSGDPVTISLTALGIGSGSVLGTPAYMSPEQAVGAELDARSDVFSFGVILYELVCGQRPFRGDTPQDTLHQVTVFDPPPVRAVDASIPQALAALIERCLRKDKEKRPASMAVVVEELAGLEAVVPGRRRLVAALVGAAAIAGGGGFWFTGQREGFRRVVISLQAQQMAAGQPVGAPYFASPQDVFRAGWRFRLRAESREPGFLYVINDGPGEDGKNRLWVLFTASNSERNIETGWYVFDDTPGTEQVWLVWSANAVPDLRPGPVGEAPEADRIEALMNRFRLNSAPVGNGRVTVEGQSDILATRLELRHMGR